MDLSNNKVPLKPPNPNEKPQRRLLFKKKRAGVVLSREEVKAIKEGRKKLRKEMRAQGLKSKKDFELTASSLGLYFDKNNPFLAWLWSHWLASLLGLLAAFLLILFLFSIVQYLRGHYTINLSEGMFREGFTLSETEDFLQPTTQLFAAPQDNVPCVSISQIPLDIDEIDGEHHDTYFAYTYYIRNEGESTVNYDWTLDINTETLDASEAVWVMVFEDGEMKIYAHESANGREEALPAFGDNTRGYSSLRIKDLAPDSHQFEVVATVGNRNYWRVIPERFISEQQIAAGKQTNVDPMDIHKYTVVLYLEGDDPECTDEMIGAHLGVEMNFRLETEEGEDKEGGIKELFESIFESLKFL